MHYKKIYPLTTDIKTVEDFEKHFETYYFDKYTKYHNIFVIVNYDKNRISESINKLMDIVDKNNGYIAGGYVAHLIHGSYYNDIDIICDHIDDYSQIVRALMYTNYKLVNKYGDSYHYSKLGIIKMVYLTLDTLNINLILTSVEKYHPDNFNIYTHFDMDGLMFKLSNKIISTDSFEVGDKIDDILNKKWRVINSKVSSEERIEKYLSLIHI